MRRRQWASAGLRLWAAVSLALYFVFWLELDNPHGAGTSAAIVYQPSLGASLRKALFRMIGTVVGAVAIVVLTACFPQNRIGFLMGLAAHIPWPSFSELLQWPNGRFAPEAATRIRHQMEAPQWYTFVLSRQLEWIKYHNFSIIRGGDAVSCNALPAYKPSSTSLTLGEGTMSRRSTERPSVLDTIFCASTRTTRSSPGTTEGIPSSTSFGEPCSSPVRSRGSSATFEDRKQIERSPVAQLRRHRYDVFADRYQPNLVFRPQSFNDVADTCAVRQIKLHARYAIRQKSPEVSVHVDFDPDHASPALCFFAIFSAVMGNDVIQMPVAAAIAFATVAGGAMQGGSPTPLAPWGQSADGHSTRINSTWRHVMRGRHLVVGQVGIDDRPSL